MVKKWLHIYANDGWGIDPWILPIWTAVNKAVDNGKMKKLEEDVYELGGYISQKLEMLPRIANRINKEGKVLWKTVTKNKTPEYEFTRNKRNKGCCAFEVPIENYYELLIDIDSLLFELKSCCELMNEFIRQIYIHTGIKIGRKDIGKKIKNIIKDEGGNSQWFIDLADARDFFIHNGAPDFAVDLSNEPKYDLLIMKRNLKKFENEKEFIRLSKLNEITQGFLKTRALFQRHLIQYIGKFQFGKNIIE